MPGKIKISIILTERAISGKWIKPLALYHAMKFTFGNSVVYDYKKRKDELAEKFQVSTRTLHKYLKILHREGLCFESSNGSNLHLSAIKQIKREMGDKWNYRISLTIHDDLNLISTKLYGKIIEQHLRKIAFAYVMEIMKKYGKRNLYKRITSETAAVPSSLSIRNIAKLLNVSKDKGTKIIKILEEEGIIEVTPQRPIKLSDGYIDIATVDDYPGYKFATKHGTFLQFGNKIEIVEYPITPPRITFQVFKKYYTSQ